MSRLLTSVSPALYRVFQGDWEPSPCGQYGANPARTKGRNHTDAHRRRGHVLGDDLDTAFRRQSRHRQSPPSVGIGNRPGSSAHQQFPDGSQLNSVPHPEQMRRRTACCPTGRVMGAFSGQVDRCATIRPDPYPMESRQAHSFRGEIIPPREGDGPGGGGRRRAATDNSRHPPDRPCGESDRSPAYS